MKEKLKYDWENPEMGGLENQLAREMSHMLLFGSDVKNVKSKLKEINLAKFPSNRKNSLPNSKFCFRKG